ncbi:MULTISPECIES: DUF6059 family protein [unclassified Streptomyces]|uniref:DUF6059 family protein n=1 Tax=unclassified Streptomyces TaxID=2593676 RepID=UPI0022540CAC|nr:MULTISPECIES: DUF6059 family protein [unclassified Streptomyces]MCX5330360.1 hypothetical protein [Streptomyces sp. NBC_00140]MCX5359759.1 hypothetical protein [Streptomyces sp. NBC_00124]
MASLCAWLLRAVQDSLIAFGRIWVWIPPVEPPRPPKGPPPGRPKPLEGPPPGHPERLCPDVPLSAVEAEILRHLPDSDPPTPTPDR